MYLERLGDQHIMFASELSVDEDGNPSFRLLEFGKGTEKTSGFRIGLYWEDVEKLIDWFGRVGEQRALSIQEAAMLRDAVENSGWKRNASPSG